MFYAQYVNSFRDRLSSGKLVSDDQATLQCYDDWAISVAEILITPTNKSFTRGSCDMYCDIAHEKIGYSAALRVRRRKAIVGYWFSGQPTVERSTNKMLQYGTAVRHTFSLAFTFRRLIHEVAHKRADALGGVKCDPEGACSEKLSDAINPERFNGGEVHFWSEAIQEFYVILHSTETASASTAALCC